MQRFSLIITFCLSLNFVFAQNQAAYLEVLETAKQSNSCTHSPESYKKITSIVFPNFDVSDATQRDFFAKKSLEKYEKTKHQLSQITHNPKLKDSLIDGRRYILMQAWKSKGFENFIKKEDNGRLSYQSSSPLFQHALFLCLHSDFEAHFKPLFKLPEEEAKTHMRQCLGLPPNSTNETVYSFWVYEGDIFRPCPDSSLNTNKKSKYNPDYFEQYWKFAYNSYQDSNVFYRYPFTGLGYTWSYAPNAKEGFGLTEFVLKEDRKIYVHKAQSMKEFFEEK